MRLTVAIFLVVLLAVKGVSAMPDSAPNQTIQYFLSAENKQFISTDKVSRFVEKLAAKQSNKKNDAAFLAQIFHKTHQRFLKKFSENASFSELIDRGVYNCLTATALYSGILERLNYDYTIIETNYHIFLLVNTSEGKVMLETTDPVSGFINDAKEITQRINKYKNDAVNKADQTKTYYSYQSAVYNSIDTNELLGLLHYNLAVQAYNKKDLDACVSHMEKSGESYRSNRSEEFTRIILLTLLELPENSATKGKLLPRVQSLRKSTINAVASR